MSEQETPLATEVRSFIGLRKELGRQLRLVAAGLDMTMREYVDVRLQQAVDADMPRVLESMTTK